LGVGFGEGGLSREMEMTDEKKGKMSGDRTNAQEDKRGPDTDSTLNEALCRVPRESGFTHLLRSA